MERKNEILETYFGYTSFRNGQEELIDAQLSGQDALGIMPTGGGKSLCYQIPALMMDGITLVVSPLISLMKDQVMALKSSGIAAAYINSSLSPKQIRLAYYNMGLGKYKIIYIAPERLLTEGFLESISQVKISMLTVDEAHCISQWGQDFRPSYLRIAEFLALLPERPVVSAFTATATDRVRADIVRLLGLQNARIVVTGFDRPNLRFEVLKPANKPAALLELMASRRDRCGIIYCATRREVEKVCQQLQEHGFSATRYHAGLEDEERRTNQDDFVYDRCDCMVATNAFGMGINKSNVSFVIHYNMPQSIEAYYQEAGRAGRDGSPADCILLYSPGDIQTAKFLIQHPNENDMLTAEEQERVVARDLARLEQMVSYCKTDRCLRGYILDYFGQSHPERCQNCGNCDTDVEKTDITQQARIIISGMTEVQRKLGYHLGVTTIVRLLHGSRDKRILALELDELPCHGRLHDISRPEIRAMMDELERQGYLEIHPDHGAIYPTQKGREVLRQQETVEMAVSRAAAPVRKPQQTPSADSGLFQALKDLRLRLSMEANVPVYIIFSNATLQDMAEKAPRTIEELLRVKGVGQYKAAQYGKAFLTEIRRYTTRKS